MVHHSKNDKNRSAERGFTLIELATAIFIVGIITSTGLIGYSYYTYNLQVNKTEERFDAVLDALSSYAQQYARLPCPADPGGDGLERDDGLCFTTASTDALRGAMEGVIPWRTLGIEEKLTRDGWGRYITYKPAAQLTINNYSAEQQVKTNDPSNEPDIHNACRTSKWFTAKVVDGGQNTLYWNHRDRARALFCCNAPPKENYLDAVDGEGGSVPGGWKDQAVLTAGSYHGDVNDSAAQNSNQWIDDLDNNTSGTFDVVEQNFDNILPQNRATAQAVTLISHGRNGLLSYMKDGTRKGEGTLDANADAAETLVADSTSGVSGMTYNPKSSLGIVDFLSKRRGADDDMTVYLRSDQVFSRVGNASCVAPPPQFRICDSYKGFKSESLVIDSSMSMLEETNIKVPRLNSDGSLMTEEEYDACKDEMDADPLSTGNPAIDYLPCGAVSASTPGYESALTRWQLAAKAAGLITRELANAKTELVEVNNMGGVGLNYFTGTEVSSDGTENMYETSGDEDLYNDTIKAFLDNPTDLANHPLLAHPEEFADYTFTPVSDADLAAIQTAMDAGDPEDVEALLTDVRELYYLDRAQTLSSELGVQPNYEYDGTDALGRNIVETDEDGNPVTTGPARMSVTTATPPSYWQKYTHRGRGTPLVSNILETAELMAEKDANATRDSIVVISDGLDHTTPPPSSSDRSYACGADGNEAFCEATKKAIDECAISRTSDACVKALFAYTSNKIENDYPGRFAIQVIDVGGESQDVLQGFYEDTGIIGNLVDASADSTGESLIESMRLALDLCTEESETPSNFGLYSDMYTQCEDEWHVSYNTCSVYEKPSTYNCTLCLQARADGDAAAEALYCDHFTEKLSLWPSDYKAHYRYCWHQRGPDSGTDSSNYKNGWWQLHPDFNSAYYSDDVKAVYADPNRKCNAWCYPTSSSPTTPIAN